MWRFIFISLVPRFLSKASRLTRFTRNSIYLLVMFAVGLHLLFSSFLRIYRLFIHVLVYLTFNFHILRLLITYKFLFIFHFHHQLLRMGAILQRRYVESLYHPYYGIHFEICKSVWSIFTTSYHFCLL